MPAGHDYALDPTVVDSALKENAERGSCPAEETSRGTYYEAAVWHPTFCWLGQGHEDVKATLKMTINKLTLVYSFVRKED